MRNKHDAPCYYCGQTVLARKGEFEKPPAAFGKIWRAVHTECRPKAWASKTTTGQASQPKLPNAEFA